MLGLKLIHVSKRDHCKFPCISQLWIGRYPIKQQTITWTSDHQALSQWCHIISPGCNVLEVTGIISNTNQPISFTSLTVEIRQLQLISSHWITVDVHWWVHVIMMAVDVLVPNRHQGICNHHDDSTMTIHRNIYIYIYIYIYGSYRFLLYINNHITHPRYWITMAWNIGIIMQQLNKLSSREVGNLFVFTIGEFVLSQW